MVHRRGGEEERRRGGEEERRRGGCIRGMRVGKINLYFKWDSSSAQQCKAVSQSHLVRVSQSVLLRGVRVSQSVSLRGVRVS